MKAERPAVDRSPVTAVLHDDPVPGLPDLPPPSAGRAGRNLPAAIAVGLALAVLVTLPLFTVRWAFIGVLVAAVLLGIREVVRALRRTGMRAPIVPLLVGGAATVVLAYAYGAGAQVVALVLTVVGCMAWRLITPSVGHLRDLAASAYIAVYVPFLASFCALLAMPPDGPRRVTVFIATTVASDVGGYAVGVFLGRHPMAPSVSPRKSWEGFAGSVVASMACGAVLLTTLLGGQWWQGLLYGAAVACTATLGDLGESMVKRDIGIKDMGDLLPGHGGVMDRIDSLLPTAPVAWLLLTAFVAAPS